MNVASDGSDSDYNDTDTATNFEVDYHILSSFDRKKSVKYYVGRTIEEDLAEKEVITTFMRRGGSAKVGSSVFSFPEEENVFTHCMFDIVMKFLFPT